MNLTPNEIITIIIASYGALLSTLLAIYEIRKDSKKIHLGMVIDLGIGTKDEFEMMEKISYFESITIFVTNISKDQIQIDNVGMRTNKGSINFASRKEDGLPKMLQVSEGFSVDFSASGLMSLLKSEAETNKNRDAYYKDIYAWDNGGHTYTKKLDKRDRKYLSYKI